MTSACIGSFVYLILLLIDAFALAPIACANNADYPLPISETHGENALVDAPKTVKTLLRSAMGQVASDNTSRVEKCLLSEGETDTVLTLVLLVLVRIPFE